MGVILLVGVAIVAAGLAVYFYKRKQAAEAQAYRSDNLLSDLMAAEMAMKASQLETYKAMLRQPNPRPQNSRFEWEETPRRRF